MSGYDALNVSNNILERSFRENTPVSPMKLQKILYFAAAEYAKATGRPLLDGNFEAWQYGPVLRSVYSEFKGYGARPITSYSTDARGVASIIREDQDPALATVLDKVWRGTKGRSAVELSRDTHAPGSAWSSAYRRGGNSRIDFDDMRSDESYVPLLGFNA
ncbi:hypothetical protein C5E06_09595 [Pseudoclavibacter sp. RFBI5]|uniref:Panacea domain-containing protein n=1 Tax=Pseudoclavibacter sp. RFBI5 TaxID=2080578 RepID=UPI000CE866DE|nr:type II toxin-antitoxin system antitoxin SocA domain-containing protein [Pseudoclavibacter sp. RFBI5]PPG02697.1 hypothetical protein C5E06_09595 [Pseudoclavibacter sp. RFBI5]